MRIVLQEMVQFCNALLVHRTSGLTRNVIDDGDKLRFWIRFFYRW